LFPSLCEIILCQLSDSLHFRAGQFSILGTSGYWMYTATIIVTFTTFHLILVR